MLPGRHVWIAWAQTKSGFERRQNPSSLWPRNIFQKLAAAWADALLWSSASANLSLRYCRFPLPFVAKRTVAFAMCARVSSG